MKGAYLWAVGRPMNESLAGKEPVVKQLQKVGSLAIEDCYSR
jgi:hypothetical protein